MERKKVVVMLILSMLAAGGVSAWLITKGKGISLIGQRTAPADVRYQYVTLDKLVVLLNQPAEQTQHSHYLALDLAFQVANQQERGIVKEQMPRLHGIALKALSGRTMEEVRSMTIDQFVEVLNRAFLEDYGSEANKPFSDIIIRKLIIE